MQRRKEEIVDVWDDLKIWCEEYGFELSEENGEYVIWGKSAFEDEAVEWIWYDVESDTVQAMNTDKNNMWLYEGRPDLSADDIVEMSVKLAEILSWTNMTVSNIVDPEDWQEIADVRDAYSDPRFKGRVLDLA
jgi:hypothetical protein